MAKELNGDLGKLLLRVSVGGLMIFHGVAKLTHGHVFIKELLIKNKMPELLWLGVPIGEVLAPLCILLGIFTRISSLIVAFTMVMSIYLTQKMAAFNITATGGLSAELNFFFLFTALALFFLGAGKYSLYKGGKGIYI